MSGDISGWCDQHRLYGCGAIDSNCNDSHWSVCSAERVEFGTELVS